MYVSYSGEIDFDSYVGDVLSCQMGDEENQGGFRSQQCACIDSLVGYLEPPLAGPVSVSGVGCKAVVKKVLSFELKVVISDGQDWSIFTPQGKLVGTS